MRLAGILVATLALAACGRKEPVRQYTVPKDPEWKYRLFGAIAPVQDKVWYFKVVGPRKAVLARREAMLAFLKTVRMGGARPEWDLPKGWKEDAGSGFRLATLHLGSDGEALEMSVSDLPLHGSLGAHLASNVDRWRMQMGLYPVRPIALVTAKDPVKMTGAAATIVEFDGPVLPSAPKAMGAAHPPLARPAPSQPSMKDIRSIFAYEVPQGWVENPAPGGQRILEFSTGEGDHEAEVTFTIFPGQMGGLASNVNRWRGQAGLEPLSESAAEAAAKSFPFMGHDGHIVEAKSDGHSVVAVFALSEEFSMFLKMTGPTAAVEAHRQPFESLARSLKTKAHR